MTGRGRITHLVAPGLYGEVWLIDVDNARSTRYVDANADGLPDDLDGDLVGDELPIFRFPDPQVQAGAGVPTWNYRPVGATPAIFRLADDLHAVIVTGGYTDAATEETSWGLICNPPQPDSDDDGVPDTCPGGSEVRQWAVGLNLQIAEGILGEPAGWNPENLDPASPLLNDTDGSSGGVQRAGLKEILFAFPLEVGERAFEQATVAGNELFIVTDRSDVNDAFFGRGANDTGSLTTMNLDNTDTQTRIDIKTGAGSAAVTAGGKVVTGGSQSQSATQFSTTGQSVDIVGNVAKGRILWLRTR
jgi:hypothetical protein